MTFFWGMWWLQRKTVLGEPMEHRNYWREVTQAPHSTHSSNEIEKAENKELWDKAKPFPTTCHPDSAQRRSRAFYSDVLLLYFCPINSKQLHLTMVSLLPAVIRHWRTSCHVPRAVGEVVAALSAWDAPGWDNSLYEHTWGTATCWSSFGHIWDDTLRNYIVIPQNTHEILLWHKI